jgi:hypothetical protein
MENEQNELIDRAEELLEEVNNYRDQAGTIDEKVRNQSDNYVPLDNLPYGEEMIKTRELPNDLEVVISMLNNDDITKEELESATESIEEVEQTLSGCTDLPSYDDDEF